MKAETILAKSIAYTRISMIMFNEEWMSGLETEEMPEELIESIEKETAKIAKKLYDKGTEYANKLTHPELQHDFFVGVNSKIENAFENR